MFIQIFSWYAYMYISIAYINSNNQMKNNTKGKLIFTLLLFLAALPLLKAQNGPSAENSVFSIPYLRYFRQDLVSESFGCDKKIAYSSYTHPEGVRDAAYIFLNQYQFGGIRCQPKQLYLKIFGHSQNYENLVNAKDAFDNLVRSSNGRFNNIVIDWKSNAQNMNAQTAFLDQFLQFLNNANTNAYLKVPASYLCKSNNGSPYILGLKNLKKIVVEMYGQDPAAYKNRDQIFLSKTSQLEPSPDHPDKNCPKFPSYSLLSTTYPNIDFYIEKTLQHEEPGYLGDEFSLMLTVMSEVYNKKVFYDAYPPSIIRL